MKNVLLFLFSVQAVTAQILSKDFWKLEIPPSRFQQRLEAPTITLDSMYESSSKIKTVYMYDEKGQNTNATYYYKLNSDTFYSEIGRYEYKYDLQVSGRIISYVASQLINQNWDIFQKGEYKYDPKGNLISCDIFGWNSTTNRFDVRRTENKYDSLSHLLEEKWILFDATHPSGKLQYSQTHTYDTQGREIFFQFVPESDTIVLTVTNKVKIEISTVYNATGGSRIRYDSTWDLAKNAWKPSIKSESTINLKGNPIVSFAYWRDTLKNVWFEIGKTEYEYDAEGREIAFTWYEKDTSLNTWKLSQKITTPYDERGNKLREGDTVFAYDSVLSSSVIMPIFWPYKSNNRLISYSIPYSFSSTTLYYSDRVISTALEKDVPLKGITVYPNPSTDYVQVENLPVGSQCQLFDVIGNSYPHLISNASVDLRSVPSGLYFLQITQADTKKTFKIRKG